MKNKVTMTINNVNNLLGSNLQSIAALCPYTDGIGVYQARSILAVYDPYGTEYLNPCELNDEPNNERVFYQEEQVQSIVAYPNPASNEINIEYEISTNAVMFIYNTLGEIVHKEKLIADNNTANIKLDKFINGIYVCEIKEETGEIQKIKFSVIK